MDNTVRHCGMLVAEVVAQNAGKKLDFHDWVGDDAGKPWTRELRQLIKVRDVDTLLDVPESSHSRQDGSESSAEPPPPKRPRQKQSEATSGHESDDSMTGYASSTSSRSPSPTPSELDEIEKDPTLQVGVKKIPRPVYLAQLGEMVRSTGGLKANDASQEADKIEMALNCAEELIRKRRNYGTELGGLMRLACVPHHLTKVLSSRGKCCQSRLRSCRVAKQLRTGRF
jgi:telomere length regulation protein